MRKRNGERLHASLEIERPVKLLGGYSASFDVNETEKMDVNAYWDKYVRKDSTTKVKGLYLREVNDNPYQLKTIIPQNPKS